MGKARKKKMSKQIFQYIVIHRRWMVGNIPNNNKKITPKLFDQLELIDFRWVNTRIIYIVVVSIENWFDDIVVWHNQKKMLFHLEIIRSLWLIFQIAAMINRSISLNWSSYLKQIQCWTIWSSNEFQFILGSLKFTFFVTI